MELVPEFQKKVKRPKIAKFQSHAQIIQVLDGDYVEKDAIWRQDQKVRERVGYKGQMEVLVDWCVQH